MCPGNGGNQGGYYCTPGTLVSAEVLIVGVLIVGIMPDGWFRLDFKYVHVYWTSLPTSSVYKTAENRRSAVKIQIF